MKAPLTTDGNTTTHLALSRSPWGILSGMSMISVMTFPAFSTRSFSFLSSALAEDTTNTVTARNAENPFISSSCELARATPSYFSAPASDTTVEPPFACTYCVRTGTNLPAIPGDSPSDLNKLATDASSLLLPGKEDARESRGELLFGFGAAFNNPSIPGTAFDTLLKSSTLSFDLASPTALQRRRLLAPA